MALDFVGDMVAMMRTDEFAETITYRPGRGSPAVASAPVAYGGVWESTPTTNWQFASWRVGTVSGELMRVYLEFDLSGIPASGIEILSAMLVVYQKPSIACDGTPIDVYKVAESFDPEAVTWDTQPEIASTPVAQITPVVGEDGLPSSVALAAVDIASAIAVGDQSIGIALRQTDEAAGNADLWMEPAGSGTAPSLAITYATAGREITAIVDRVAVETIEGIEPQRAPRITLTVANSATHGISSDEIDRGTDRVLVPLRFGKAASEMGISEIIDHDEGALTLEVA